MKSSINTAPPKQSGVPAVRCAIYTRKSSEQGLEQEFNSLHAQRESAEAYIASMKHEGWVALPDQYNDGGFTGGNTDRPGCQRLMADIEAGKVDCVVVYKVDRLSRSLLDFARMMAVFEKHRVSFVSVTQQFNTTQSMGRLTLNILLSFAQFEREIISERTRDKIAASKRKGKWFGGKPILGYDLAPQPAGGSKLVVNAAEAELVREVYHLYLEHRSLTKVAQILNARGSTSKRWTTRKGTAVGGRVWDKHLLINLLTNPAYVGKVKHKKELFAGEHAAIVDERLWQQVFQTIKHNGRTGGMHVRNQHGALLKGLIHCGPCGHAMGHTYSVKDGKAAYRYYVCYVAQKQGWHACPSGSLPAEQIERLVVDRIKHIGGDSALVRVADVAEVNIGAEIRRGAVTYDGKGEAILGLGFMLMGENSHDVTSRLRDKLTEIRPFLPAGVSVDIVYDRTELVDQVIDTVRKNLFEGGLLVIAVLFVFLGNLRAGLIVASAIPLSMLFAFDSMLRFGISGSLLSLGAIDFGLVVDSSVIMIENTMRHLAHDRSSRRKIDIVRDAAIEVRKPTMFGELIIIIVFLPILTLEGVEGKMFKPMALTFIFALVGSLVLSLTLMPVLASLLLPRKVQEREPLVVRLAHMVYAPLLRLAQRSRLVVIGLALALLAVTVMGIRGLGAEFVPKLGEGSIVANTIRLAGTDIDESIRMNTVMEKEILRQFPDEVEHVWSRIGTAEVATDPMGVELTDIFMTLRPRSQWKRAATREELVREMDHALRDLPGQRVAFTQPIEMRMNEMSAGIKADVGIKLYGDDLSVLTNKSGEIAAVLEGIKGATDVSVEQLIGQPVLQVRVLPDAIARYGIPASEVLELVESLGTMELGTVVEGQLRFPLVSRLPDRLRSSPEAIGSVLITAPNGERVPLSKLASIQETEGPSTITREWGQRRSTIQANVRGRDIGSFVTEAQAAIASEVQIPPGRYRLEWGGQFENLQRAQTRLAIVVPVALLLIFLLLYLSFKSTRLALLVYTGVPFAVVGGVAFLWARGLPFSISAGVGFIALSGVAVLNGLVMVTFIRQLRRRGVTLQQAIFEGCMVRLRPVLMTATVAALGFIPMALATGVGAEVQRPLATVVIGGVISSTILTLFVLPILYPWFEPKGDAEMVDGEEQGAGPGHDPARAAPGAYTESTNGLVAAPSIKPATV